MPGVFDNIMLTVFTLNFALTIAILLFNPFASGAYGIITGFSGSYQVINGSQIITVTPQVPPASFPGVSVGLVNASLSQWYYLMYNMLTPINPNSTVITLTVGGYTINVPNPNSIIGLLFNILSLIFSFIENMLITTPAWVQGMMSLVFPSNLTTALATVYWFLSMFSFFWFIINYVWQPLSWIVGLLLASLSSVINAVKSILT